MVKATAQRCTAEELDSARARVLALGDLSSAAAICTSETDDGLRRVLVFAQRSRAVCGGDSDGALDWKPDFRPGEPPPKQLTCSGGVVSDGGGNYSRH